MAKKKAAKKSKTSAKARKTVKKAAARKGSGRKTSASRSKKAARKTSPKKTGKAAGSVKRAKKTKAGKTKAAKSARKPQKTAARKKSTSAKKKPARKTAAAKPKKRGAAKAAAKKTAARKTGVKKKTAAKKTVTKKAPAAKRPETRSLAVRKLLALKDEKAKKAAKKRDFLIRAPKKKVKKADLVSPPRFIRRVAAVSQTPAAPAKSTPRARKVVLRKREIEELRRALDDERTRLLAHLAHLDEAASLKGPSDVNEDVPGYSIHLAEYASDNQAVETTLVQRGMQAERLSEIEQALQRIDQPGYGLCQGCSSPIGIERLKIKPFAALCVHCRVLKEQGRL